MSEFKGKKKKTKKKTRLRYLVTLSNTQWGIYNIMNGRFYKNNKHLVVLLKINIENFISEYKITILI